MSSAICQNFVQNTWRKDLCSNCFKSKDEHSQPKPKPVSVSKTQKTIEGIIKSTSKSKPKRSVEFTKQLSEVIGYGGEDWYSDDEEDDGNVDDDDDDHLNDAPDGEEDRELQRLTRANTDYNANMPLDFEDVKIGDAKIGDAKIGDAKIGDAKIGDVKNGDVKIGDGRIGDGRIGDGRKSYTQLLLGKPLVGSDGKKQTLMVSVTPFGQENPAKKYTKSVSLIPVAKTNKDMLVESKTNVVLTSYVKNSGNEEKSLLDEITETLESGKNPIQIISKKNTDVNKKNTDFNKKNTDIIKNTDKENICDESRATEIESNNDKQNKSIIPEKKNGLNRTTVIKRDQEKPVIYQTSIAKIELMNTKNSDKSPNNAQKEEKLQNSTKLVQDSETRTSESIEPSNSTSNKDDTSDDSLTTSSIGDESKTDSEEATPEEITRSNPLGLPPKRPMVTIQSREQAGEPDGRADPEEIEPPALPLTPPPLLETHGSFLHGGNAKPPNIIEKTPIISEKPKVPSKPSTITIRKPVAPPILPEIQPILTTFIPDKTKLEKQDSNGSDIYKANNSKRKAPLPPSDEQIEDKKDRYSMVSDDANSTPEPAPRRSLSLSSDNLLTSGEEKKKRGRFSLKKFLRMGSSKELAKIANEPTKIEELVTPPPVKPRLVIVHPLELNGEKVEVLAKPNNPSIDVGDYCNITTPQRANKPPPPPRNLEEYPYIKPNLPHPPKSQEILNKQREFSSNNNSKKVETVYANIGEVRSAIVPNKPHRTASMREREALQQKRNNNNYEPIEISKDSNENVYDYISSARSSSPECDSNKSSPTTKKARQNGLSKRSESHIDVTGDYFKYQNIPRSLSLTYCGSETESEIYSPYTFYGSESEVADEDAEWATSNGKPHKLRSKKGRSIVHKNLEDNYGAVVVANHEALAQVLENIQQSVPIQPALRGLKATPSLRWSDFTIKGSGQSFVIGPRAFHQGIWGSQHVTLVVCTGTITTSTLGVFSLNPITEFSDLIPKQYLPGKHGADIKHLQATVAVLPWMQVHTLETYGEYLKSKPNQNPDDFWKDASFVLLQFVNALKILQAQGIEELPASLSSFLLCREVDKDSYYRVYVLQGLGEDITRKKIDDTFSTLCVCATNAMKQLQVTSKITTLIQSLLRNERAVSLTQVKSVLEFSLWGPSDVALGTTVRERELALQRWLDLQRATVLHGLVCTKVHLTVYEEFHLLFLVRSTARMMCDASMLLESNSKQNGVVGNGIN